MTRILEPVIEDLRETALRMGSRAEAILEKALRALLERDVRLASEVQHDDVEIDRLDVEIDDAVLRALALQAPVAGDLREVVAIKMIATDLERVGDLARNIAKSAERLANEVEVPLPPALLKLASGARQQLRRSLDAYGNCDATAARVVMTEDDVIDLAEDQVVLDELAEIAREPETAKQAVDVILIAKNLERVGDHATNIAEDVILVAEARNVKHNAKLAR
jgi:phosphate transport system protein